MAMMDWNEVEVRSSNEGSGSKVSNEIYLNFKQGKFKVRLVHKPIFYKQYFIDPKYSSFEKVLPIIVDPDDDPLADLGHYGGIKCATNVIDREDGKVKVLRCGKTVYENFAAYAQETEVAPGSKDGPDFLIKVDDPNGDKRQRKYKVIPLAPAPFTAEEKAMFKDKAGDSGIHSLEEIFAAKTGDEVKEMIEKFSIQPDDSVAEKLSEAPSSGESSFSDGEDDDIPF